MNLTVVVQCKAIIAEYNAYMVSKQQECILTHAISPDRLITASLSGNSRIIHRKFEMKNARIRRLESAWSCQTPRSI
jgi:hypothetical protein